MRDYFAIVRSHRRRHLALRLPPDHITCCPDMGHARPQGAIYAHRSCPVKCYSCFNKTQPLCVWHTSGSHQEFFGTKSLLTTMPIERERYSLSIAFHPTHLRPGHNAYPFFL